MAQKIGSRPAATRTTAQADQTAADELDILHPERTITLSIGTIVVREYGAVEWMRMLPAAESLIASISAMLAERRIPIYEEALAVIAKNIDALLPFIAAASGLEHAVVEALAPDDFELLLMTWWGVNGRFFVGRARNRIAVARAEMEVVVSASENSTQPLSPTATTSTESGATPSAS